MKNNRKKLGNSKTKYINKDLIKSVIDFIQVSKKNIDYLNQIMTI